MNARATLRQAGFSLVEVTVALGIAAFSLLAIFGLLPVGLNTNKLSIEQSDASNLAVGVISDLESAPKDPASAVKTPRFNFLVPAPDGAASGNTPQVIYYDRDGNSLGQVGSTPSAATVPFFRVSVGFVPPTKTLPVSGARAATQVRIAITWPAGNPKDSTWQITYAGSFETVYALNRN